MTVTRKRLKHLIIDTNNVLFRVATSSQKYGPKNESEQDSKDAAGFAMHSTLTTLRSYFNKIKPDVVALSFEGRNNWRKAHTLGNRPEGAVSGLFYKGNRLADASMIPFFELLASFKDLAINHTTIICVHHDDLEGDDCISGYTQKYSALDDEVTVLSDDKDFITLLQLANVKLLRPDGTYRGIDKKTNKVIDPKFFMYEKAFRGDIGDHVLPAFPRVRVKRLQKAWDDLQKGDTYEHSNLMNETWEYTNTETGISRTMKVGDLYAENIILMDLVHGQPKDIKDLMIDTVDKAVLSHGKFNLFKFQSFCGKFKLKKISENVMNFVPMLSKTITSSHNELGVEVDRITQKGPKSASALKQFSTLKF